MRSFRKISKGMLLLVVVALLWGSSVNAYAQEAVADLSKLMIAKSAVDALEDPTEQSATVFSYQAEDSVFVTGETASGWYRVAYQDKVGFVKKTDLKDMDINVSELNEEFENNEIEGKVFVEEVARIRAQITRSRIWGTIIIVLIAGIFATGIYSTIKSEHKKRSHSMQNDAITGKEEEMVDPLTFKASDISPLDMIDLDEPEA